MNPTYSRARRSGPMAALVASATVASALLATALAPLAPPPEPLLLRKERSAALSYAVQSRIYPEDPERMFVTTRDAGLAEYDVSEGGRPALQAQWGAAANHSLEGQDRIGDTLVVVDLNLSGLHVFRLPHGDHLVPPVGFLQFGRHGALHCRLYAAPGGGMFALVSIGHGINSPCHLAVVNVTQPDAPRLVTDVQTNVTCMEGVLVYRDYAFVGGYCDSHSLVVISLKDNIASVRTPVDKAVIG
eukprot:COSAG04_NODE_9703_length_839_cov_0.885135_1_plen_243_part_10